MTPMSFNRRDSFLSQNAQQSHLEGFLGRIGLSVVAMPLGGYCLGLWADQYWQKAISWAMVLLLLGLFAGCVYLWAWMKRPKM